MGIYDNESVRPFFISCQTCRYEGNVIDTLDGTNEIRCPSCGGPVRAVRLDVDLCQDEL